MDNSSLLELLDKVNIEKKIKELKYEYVEDVPFLNITKSILKSNLNLYLIRSFETLLTRQLNEIINANPVANQKYEGIIFFPKFHNLKVTYDDISSKFYHQKNKHYTCNIFVDISLHSEIHTAVEGKHKLIGRMPMMTGVDKNFDYDLLGTFITRGKNRIIPASKTAITDFPIFYKSAEGTFMEFRALNRGKLYRSSSSVEISISNQKNKGKFFGTIDCFLPFAPNKKKIHIAVIAVCLGANITEFINLIRICAKTKYKEHIFKSYEASLHQNNYSPYLKTKEDALLVISKLYHHKGLLSTGMTQIRNEFFPHIISKNDSKDSDTIDRLKLILLASVCSELILKHENLEETNGRSDYSVSQIMTAANAMGSLFRSCYIRSLWQIGKCLHDVLKSNQAHKLPNLDTINLDKICNEFKFSQMMIKAVSTGIWTAANNGVSISLNSNNEDAIKLQLRNIQSKLKGRDGAFKDERGNKKDQYGFICPIYSPDGAEAGFVNELSMFATVTHNIPDFMHEVLMSLIIDYSNEILIDIIKYMEKPYALSDKERLLVNSTGVITHIITDSNLFIENFLYLRRSNIIDRFVFIADYNPKLVIFYKEGIVARPLIIASKINLIDSNYSLSDCLKNGLIEYVSPQEQSTLVKCVMSQHQITKETTHVEILQCSFMGLIAGFVAFANCEQTARITLVCGHLKQAIVPGGKKDRNTQTKIKLYYGFEKMVKTLVETLNNTTYSGGNGTPCTVILWPDPFTNEDGVICKKSFTERGGMMCGITTTYTSEILNVKPTSSIVETFGYNKQSVSKKTNSTHAIDAASGLAIEGSHVDNQAIVIAKFQQLHKPCKPTIDGVRKNIVEFRDISIPLRKKNKGQVVCAKKEYMPEGIKASVSVEQRYMLQQGDKITTQEGLKAVISRIVPDQDLPFSAQTGIIPDFTFAVFSPFGRQVPSFYCEGIVAKTAALYGKFQTDYQQFDTSRLAMLEFYGNLLVQKGFNRNGKEIFIHGKTGEEAECEVFTGEFNVIRLNHNAEEKLNIRSTGSIDPKTRQPKDGRKQGSGAKVSDMDYAAFQAHGVAHISQQRFGALSDHFCIYVCQSCSMLVDDVGVDIDFAWCRRCASLTSTVEIEATFIMLKILYFFNSLGISTYFHVKALEEENKIQSL